MEIDMGTEIKLEYVLLDEEFEKWLGQNVTDEEIYEKMISTMKHFNRNGLIAILSMDQKLPGYSVLIRGIHDAEGAGISFDFNRKEEGSWYFGIEIEQRVVTNKDGIMIDMEKQGYSRLLMGIMFYCLEKKVPSEEKPKDLTGAGEDLLIGIDTDASGGFWEYIGMEPGKYSMDGPRYDSKVGAAVGFEKEFQVRNWKQWLSLKGGGVRVYQSKKRKYKPRKHKKKKSKKYKSKSKKHTKRKKKRKSKRKSKKSKMR
tara:strand:+ start:287 stop:1057 length:771 start_codon:yes stop_codon:yes gene_type:complete